LQGSFGSHVAVSLQIHDLNPGLDVLQATRAFSAERLLVLLDSAARHRERDARYSFLTADPIAVCQLDAITIRQPVFEPLRQWQQEMSLLSETDTEDLPPFFGGIAGLLSYEFGHAFERLPQPTIDEFRTPALLAGLYDWAIVWDHLSKTVRCYVLTFSPRSETGGEKPQGLDRFEWILSRLQRDPPAQQIRSIEPQTSRMDFAEQHRIEPSTPIYSSFTRDSYLKSVSRVIEYIRAGDIFQANLSQRLLAEWSGSAVELYGRVRQNNPAPFCGLFQADDFAVVSASPERFLKVDRNRLVETRPIKGTRRRPRSPIADLFAGDELSASEKDRAENVMIVDLLRNDISRNCSTGSVKVTGLCEIERFETVLHLVSTIQGILGENRDVWDLLGGCFPGGSITGAPKIRAMEIIAELEPTVRGAYCGSLFALGPAGDFDSSILIRTFTLKNGWVQFPVGGGIVADSDPLDEYRETLHKASGLIRTLGR
jgi:para-aminobenzoate synthetase component 1